MSEFNPYLKWLGIREMTRPINHYRLLGLDLFESDMEVISMAADRQMVHVRTYQNGPQGERSQELLSELARARRCLLTPDQKEAYDHNLRESLLPVATVAKTEPDVEGAEAADEPPLAHEVDQVISVDGDVVSQKASHQRGEKKRVRGGLVGWIFGGLAAVGVAAFLIASGLIPMGGVDDIADDGQVAQLDPEKLDPEKVDPEKVDSETVDPLEKSDDLVAVQPDSTNQSKAEYDNLDNEPAVTIPPVVENERPNDQPRNKITPTQFDRPQAAQRITRDKVWKISSTASRLSRYPRPQGDALELFKSIRSQVEATAITTTIRSGASQRTTGFQDVPTRSPSILIGFRVWVDGNVDVSAVQPIFSNLRRTELGRRSGQPTPEFFDVIAKPGYGVAAVTVSADFPVHAIQLEFQAVNSTGLDPSTRYFSPRIGRPIGAMQTIKPPQNRPVVGYAPTAHVDSKLFATISLVYPTGERAKNVAAVAKKPVPSGVDLAPFRRRFATRFRRDINNIQRAQNDPAIQRGLVTQFAAQLEMESLTEADAVNKFLLLMESMKRFSATGELDSAIRALDRLHDEYQVDYWKDLNVVIFTSWTGGIRSAGQAAMFRKRIDQKIATAVDEKLYGEAMKLVNNASQIFGRSNELKKHYKRQRDDLDDIRSILEDFELAKVKLNDDPRHEKSHLAMGNYFAFVDDDLKLAVKHWAKSGRKSLVRLAELDDGRDQFTGAQDVQKMEDLAKAWARLGKGQKSRHKKARMRAANMYDIASRQDDVDTSKKKNLRKKRDNLRKAKR